MMEISDYFKGTTDVLTLDMGIETQWTHNHVTIGGSSEGVENDTRDESIAFHELAHFIEGDDEMVTLPDFGLPDGGALARTKRFFDKEVDTFAIQIVLENQSGRRWEDRHWDSYHSIARFIDYTTRFGDPVKTEKLLEARAAHCPLESILLELERKVELLRALPRG